LLARNRDFISFFLGFLYIYIYGAKEKPGFMVTGNSDFTPFFHEFCIGYSLCAAYFLHGKKNGIYCPFFNCWLFSFDLLSFSLFLSLLPKKSQDL